MPLETEKHSLMMIGGKQNGGQRPGGRNYDGSGTTKSEDFFVSGFRTHVVATTVCATGCVHTLRVARTFSNTFFLALRTDIAYTHGVCSAHVMSLHLTLSFLMFHPPSLLFPHGHFETTFLSAQSLPDFTRSESTGQAHFRTSGGEFGYLADPTHSTLLECIAFLVAALIGHRSMRTETFTRRILSLCLEGDQKENEGVWPWAPSR